MNMLLPSWISVVIPAMDNKNNRNTTQWGSHLSFSLLNNAIILLFHWTVMVPSESPLWWRRLERCWGWCERERGRWGGHHSPPSVSTVQPATQQVSRLPGLRPSSEHSELAGKGWRQRKGENISDKFWSVSFSQELIDKLPCSFNSW